MYPKEITPEELEIGFILTQIYNPTEYIQNNPWIKTEKTITAVVLLLKNGDRVVKMERPEDKTICYSHQRNDGNKWVPVSLPFISLEPVKALRC